MSASRQSRAGRWLSPEQLATVNRLELVARHVVDGYLAGMHRSSAIGASTEFAEHRSYTPGDDIRRIDWRVFGRTDRLMVKSFQAESNADVVLAIDMSASMRVGNSGPNKLQYARMLAASFAHLAVKQRDRAGIGMFDTELRQFRRPQSVLGEAFWQILDTPPTEDATDLVTALTALANRLHGRTMLFIVSDYYNDVGAITEAMARLAARHDVSAIHVVDPNERSLPWDGPQVVADAETGARVALDPALANPALAQSFAAHSDALSRRLQGIGCDYWMVETNQPLETQLHAFLHRRGQYGRARKGSRR